MIGGLAAPDCFTVRNTDLSNRFASRVADCNFLTEGKSETVVMAIWDNNTLNTPYKQGVSGLDVYKRQGTYSQDSHQDHGRPVLHLKCVHKRIGRGHHVAGQVGGHLGKKDESKGCHQQHLVMYHL